MFRIGLLALTISTAAFAQQGAPTNFETNAPQQTVPSVRPLVSTPTMTLSNGFSPATVTMPQTLVTEQPGMIVTGEMPEGDGVATEENSTEAPPADFDFAGVAASSAFDNGAAGPSLADIARRSKKYQVQPHKAYTNDDIDRMNAQPAQNGIVSATFANGQPIVARNNSGFSPESGIANLPYASDGANGTEVANTPANQNPMNEGQTNATASNADQGRPKSGQATMPSAQSEQPTQPNSGQLPASDNPR